MKLLLFGGSGQVGHELRRALAPLVGPDALFVAGRGTPFAADFLQPQRPGALLHELRPSVIVNAAAWTDVDGAEASPQAAHAVNALAPAALAVAARETGALFVHFSTEHVFDGSGDQPRDEDAATSPVNTYGATKLQGEQAIRGSGCRHLVLRTSWVHSARRPNFVRAIVAAALRERVLRVVDDQVGAPTSAASLADATAELLLRLAGQASGATAAATGPQLTLHVTDTGAVSRHGCAEFIVQVMREAGAAPRCEAVLPIGSHERPSAARRPLNSRLDTGRAQALLGHAMPPWQEGVRRTVLQCLRGSAATTAHPHAEPTR